MLFAVVVVVIVVWHHQRWTVNVVNNTKSAWVFLHVSHCVYTYGVQTAKCEQNAIKCFFFKWNLNHSIGENGFLCLLHREDEVEKRIQPNSEWMTQANARLKTSIGVHYMLIATCESQQTAKLGRTDSNAICSILFLLSTPLHTNIYIFYEISKKEN